MLAVTDKFEFYEKLCSILSRDGFLVTAYKEVEDKLEFSIEYQGTYGVIQIEESEGGVRLDLSQIPDKKIAEHVGELVVSSDELNREEDKGPKKPKKADAAVLPENPSEIIGLSESGVKDYFGPLVVAGVHLRLAQQPELKKLGIGKDLSDKEVLKIAPEIRNLCAHSLIIVANQTYNEVYEKFSNLLHIITWAYSRVIENVLNQVSCPYALTDKAINNAMINGVLMKSGKAVQIFTKPDASKNLAVAAASVLSREAYIKRFEEMNKTFEMTFPKGAGKKVVEIGRKFVAKFGEDYLAYIAKLHFDLTEEIKKV
ncbi:ribonuclease HIII [Candidatus Margulisiibacteriota bacterium]